MKSTFKKIITRKTFLIGVLLVVYVVLIGSYHIIKVRNAHDSFENYSNFRGCVQLVSKTDTSAVCKLYSGKYITLVQVKGRWFLDGDFGW